jgi:hypothetical protein
MLAHHAYWCQLLPQIKRWLLLLCQLKANPNISAYAHVYSHYYYHCHLFVPIGMEALVNSQSHKHRSFVQHCRKVFVLGTSTKHYQCWKFWLVTMCATHISGTAFFKCKYLTNPAVTPEDRVIEAVGALAGALDNWIPPTCGNPPSRPSVTSKMSSNRPPLQRWSHHSCHPSSISNDAPGCTSWACILCHIFKCGHYWTIFFNISLPLNSQNHQWSKVAWHSQNTCCTNTIGCLGRSSFPTKSITMVKPMAEPTRGPSPILATQATTQITEDSYHLAPIDNDAPAHNTQSHIQAQ